MVSDEYNNQFLRPINQTNIATKRDFYLSFEQQLAEIDKSQL